MSSNLVIAAIPDENDRVWKVSSEKIPHLTVLFLGDVDKVSNLEQIMLFVEHAANTALKRFYLPVDRRGELGDDKADVLFFKKGRYDFKAVRDFRSLLLQDNNIKTAYDAASQFEAPANVGSPGQSWIPHLTLGYPETPAKEIPDDYGAFYDVQFNKIAVWTGDFEGPDFLLKDYWDEMDELGVDMNTPVSVAMGNLSHAVKVSDTAWSQFKTSDYTDEQYARACLLDRGENAGTPKERYGIPVREPDGTLNRNACHAAASVLSSTGGTGTARGNKVKGSSEQIAKAKNKLVALYKGPLNEDVPKGLGGEDSMKQTADLGSEFVLEHYGVKGMRWGQRKTEVTVGGETKTVSTRKAAKLDKQFLKNVNSSKNQAAVRSHAISEINKKLPGFNKDKRWQDKNGNVLDLNHPSNKKVAKQYSKALELMTLQQYTKSVREVGGDSPSGRYFATYVEGRSRMAIVDEKTGAVRHAELDAFRVILDEKGYVVSMESEKQEAMAQADLVIEFLSHHGVKGQKWGVRKVEGGGEGAHIRIKEKTGRAALSKQSTAAILGPALIFPPAIPLAFLSSRVRAEVKAARAVNQGVQADKKWQKQLQSSKKAAEVHNKAAEEINQKLSGFNSDKRWKDAEGKDIHLISNPKKQKEYDRAFEDEIMNPAYSNAAIKVHGSTSPGGRYKFEIHDAATGVMKVRDLREEAKHAADDNELSAQFTILRDPDGHIVGLDPEDKEISMAQTSDMVEEFLDHHGVKGMHWGQRKVKSGAKATGRGAKKVGRGLLTFANDIAFESTSQMHATTNKVHLTAAENFRKQDIPRINAKYKDTKGGTLKGRLKNPIHPDTRAYRSESRIAYRDQVNEAVKALPGNASGTRKYEIEDSGKTNAQYGWTLKAVDVKKTVQHADSLAGALLDEFVVRPVFDEDGFITNVKMVNSTLAQTVDLGAEFLSHFGIKGMRWGVRNERAVTTQTHIDSGVLKRQTKIQTKGGVGHDAHPDAVKAAIQKQKLKKSGTAALSTNELRDLANRLQVESQVQMLVSSKGKKFIEGELQSKQSKAAMRRGVAKAAPIAAKRVKKTAATIAVGAVL